MEWVMVFFFSLELGSLGHVLLRIKLFTGFVLSIKNMVQFTDINEDKLVWPFVFWYQFQDLNIKA